MLSESSGGAKPPLRLDATSKMQLAILMGSGFLVQLALGMIIVVLPMFAQSIGLGATGVGLLVALPQVTKLLFNLPIGHLVDVIGRKPLLIVGAVIDALGQFATATSHSLAQLVPARLLVGVGSATGGTVGTATTAYTMDVVGKYPEHSGLLLGIMQATGFLAFAVGPAIGGLIGEHGGPALPFYIVGAVLLLTAPLKCLLPETLPAKARARSSDFGAATSGLLGSYRRLLVDPRQLALLALKVSFMAGLSLILTVVPLHASEAIGLAPSEFGRLYSVVTLLALVVSPLAGALADRLGRPLLAVAGSLATVLSVACMPLVKDRLVYFALRSLWAVGEAFLITAYAALAIDITDEDQRGARSSLDNQVGDLALLVLPLAFGAVGQIYSHEAAFRLASALMLAANVAFAWLNWRGRVRPRE
jgi:MFS family permease